MSADMSTQKAQHKQSGGDRALIAQPPAPVVSHAASPRTGAALMRRFVVKLLVLAVIWGMLSDWRLDAWVFGAPAVLLGAALVFVLPHRLGWRVSPTGAATFVAWFAVQSVRGAVDVSIRAFSPQMPLRPGFRRYPLTLPGGAPRVMFVNCITLLPGTLSAEIEGDALVVHMLDTRADLEADLGALQARIAALFALTLRNGDFR